MPPRGKAASSGGDKDPKGLVPDSVVEHSKHPDAEVVPPDPETQSLARNANEQDLQGHPLGHKQYLGGTAGPADGDTGDAARNSTDDPYLATSDNQASLPGKAGKAFMHRLPGRMLETIPVTHEGTGAVGDSDMGEYTVVFDTFMFQTVYPNTNPPQYEHHRAVRGDVVVLDDIEAERALGLGAVVPVGAEQAYYEAANLRPTMEQLAEMGEEQVVAYIIQHPDDAERVYSMETSRKDQRRRVLDLTGDLEGHTSGG